MRINKLLGVAVALGAVVALSASAEAKTTVRISHTQVETHLITSALLL